MGRRVEYVETVRDDETGSVVTNKHQKFVYDGYLCIQRLNGVNNSVTDLFEWDPTEPVATRPLFWQPRTAEGNFSLFYTHDGSKNVSDVVFYQRARGVAAHYEYAPFGEVIVQTRGNAWGTLNLSLLNPFRFSSEFRDDALGLVYYNYRHYDPIMGRWCTRDPAGEWGGFNFYAMCKNNAINKYDKDGQAYFALRPLSGAPWLGVFSHNIIDDLANTEIAHEHLFFEDGIEPDNYGLHDDKDVNKQVFSTETPSNYRHFERGYNDCVMRIAVANVQPKPYSLLGSWSKDKYNCQDYCSDLRREYLRLMLDNSTRKKCCVE